VPATAEPLILNTVSANLDVDAYLSLLRVDGTLVNVGAPAKPDSFRAFALIAARRSLAGSAIGGLPDTQAMLDFCAEHGITPEIELIAADELEDAYERAERSAVNYRRARHVDRATSPACRRSGLGFRSGSTPSANGSRWSRQLWPHAGVRPCGRVLRARRRDQVRPGAS
jgi:hypothetical protein